MANVHGNSIRSTCKYIVLFLIVILPVILEVLFPRELQDVVSYAYVVIKFYNTDVHGLLCRQS